MKVIGQTVAVLFLRSYERSERVYQAMLSRGYGGDIGYFQLQQDRGKRISLWSAGGRVPLFQSRRNGGIFMDYAVEIHNLAFRHKDGTVAAQRRHDESKKGSKTAILGHGWENPRFFFIERYISALSRAVSEFLGWRSTGKTRNS